ncbi:Pre-mRNA-splicing factor brr2, related [Eimeria necatrix]|uniref:Pre-mRNA-splicing factor brr2, related n=1 Tax=Eimeria necatrix TaxID=51315 RepID=U6MQD2_9EIME|nr:Pre-mRNA-splicing factor brr2, related [Eimeria necatrix]CDJ66216.1 Pre-mRNA-splicing factor brr2, related [Eimeria necatrix]
MEVKDVFDFMNMEDAQREKLLASLTQAQLREVAKASNRYPVISLEFEISKTENVSPGENLQCSVQLERDLADGDSVGPVYAPLFPKEKEEQWWLIIGEGNSSSRQQQQTAAADSSSRQQQQTAAADCSSEQQQHRAAQLRGKSFVFFAITSQLLLL